MVCYGTTKTCEVCGWFYLHAWQTQKHIQWKRWNFQPVLQFFRSRCAEQDLPKQFLVYSSNAFEHTFLNWNLARSKPRSGFTQRAFVTIADGWKRHVSSTHGVLAFWVQHFCNMCVTVAANFTRTLDFVHQDAPVGHQSWFANQGIWIDHGSPCLEIASWDYKGFFHHGSKQPFFLNLTLWISMTCYGLKSYIQCVVWFRPANLSHLRQAGNWRHIFQHQAHADHIAYFPIYGNWLGVV